MCALVRAHTHTHTFPKTSSFYELLTMKVDALPPKFCQREKFICIHVIQRHYFFLFEKQQEDRSGVHYTIINCGQGLGPKYWLPHWNITTEKEEEDIRRKTGKLQARHNE